MIAPQSSIYDLFVIGGGINGAAVACDAAGRGLAVALAEGRDFAEGTSSRSSKLIHGGLRYLETYDFRLVRDALHEREILMAKAPHLVWPIRLVLPHVPAQRPRWLIRSGLFLYDHLARRKILPGSEMVRLAGHPFGVPLKPDYEYGFVYSDCRGDDARLVIANLLCAEAHGADIFARHRVVAATRSQGFWTIDIENTRTGTPATVRARALVNAAGPWVISVAKTLRGVGSSRRLRMVRGSHIVVLRLWDSGQGYFLQTSDHRTMEVFPYEDDFTLIGTTDTPWDRPPEEVAISNDEIDYMIKEVNRYLRQPISRDDIVWSYSGVRPLFEVGGARDRELSTLTRDYSFEVDVADGAAPVLTIFGGKLTTHRRMAEDALTRLACVFPIPERGRTAVEPLPGGEFGSGGVVAFEETLTHRYGWLPVSLRRRLVRLYGTRTEALLDDARALADLGPPFGADLYRREVDFLMRTEWALTADDILWRRTKLGLRMTPDEVRRLAAYVESRTPPIRVLRPAGFFDDNPVAEVLPPGTMPRCRVS